ncbi:MAG: hypothetical protein QGF03_10425 [SAR324 cluster bacterium]|nr:hypothetical protein [SAR324 cluster bacterium]
MTDNLPSPLALIGMSGAGKSYWSHKLATCGYLRIGCDDRIADQLHALPKQSGSSTRRMADWMGLPFNPGYAEAERQYMACEVAVTEGICELLEHTPAEQPVVIDTTGSMVYVGEALLHRFKSLAMLVYLSTPPESSEQLYESFLNDPKPIVWQGRFTPRPGEKTNEATLARCLPELLESRRRDYSALANHHLDFQTLRQPGLEVQDFLHLATSKAVA